jgi:alcohol dehydrogenase class IV
MLEQYKLIMPKTVYAGLNSINNVREIVEDVKKVAIFTYENVYETGLINPIIDILVEKDIPFIVFKDLPVEPTYMQAQDVVERFNSSEANFIIAVGGGSVIDVAKLVSVLNTDKYTVKDLLETPSIAKKTIRTMMIPTTAGTGAEATPNAIVTVPEKSLKVGIVSNEMIADYVILDAEMIRNLPRPIAASTGIDALAHAIECYTSKKANPFSDLYSLSALEIIIKNIEAACDGDMNAKSNMLLASFYAGVAITTSGTTGVHALSYPLGGKYHIPHGVSNAIMLMPVMRFNEPYIRHLLANVYNRLWPFSNIEKDEEKSALVLDHIEKIIRYLDIPQSVRSFGVNKEEIDELVKGGMEAKRLLVNNMREIAEADARSMYLQVL